MSEWQTVDVDGSPMRLFVTRPAGEARGGVLVLQEAFGVNDYIQDLTGRFAKLGYLAAAPDFFHRTAPGFVGDYNDLGKSLPHMKALTNEFAEADLKAADGWLRGQLGGKPIAAAGFCLGGKLAFIANGTLELSAVSSFYGSSIPSLLEDYAAKQKAPLLLVWGGLDKHIKPEDRDRTAERLRAEKKLFTEMEFSDAEHGFFCDPRPVFNPIAAREAWAVLTRFLEDRGETKAA